jgi:(1->4)-alpha-D-glucan 1-alpha-D-glucosylmutase
MTAEPRATYRLQLTPEFGFGEVADLLDHLVRLGVSHVYLSPVAEAVPGSSHGYDVVDHTRVRAELGGAAGFEALLERAAGLGLAVVIDHVPNHVARTRPDLNPRWWALLRDGPGSPADDWFDVDWEAADGRVILPVLGAPLDEAIAEGGLEVDDDALVVYGSRRLPLAPGTESLPLRGLLAAQHYQLQYWRIPRRNFRRFFTIDDLVAVRVEQPHVAEMVDTIPARYAAHPGFGGVRVDHVDGLADPLGYLRGLRNRIGDGALLYVEKIVAPGEWLPADWPVDGTTGYEFVRLVDHLMVAAETAAAFDERWRESSGDERSFHELEADARREVAAGALAPDLARLTRLARRAVAAPSDEVAVELRRLTTELPRYRTYLPSDPDAAELVHDISDGPVAAALLDPATPEQEELRTRWQQLTGPVMAKGAEDRAFYRYVRLASLCEVGGDPGRFGTDVGTFHAENARRGREWPRAMLAASTHDTKRSEDVRARSAALTWRVSEDQRQGRRRWLELSAAWVREVVARSGVDAPTASLAWQTVVSTPGLDAERLTDYLVKATREAALHTTWEDPVDEYEDRLAELAALAVTNGHLEGIDLESLGPGISLAATTLRLMAPGVPDIYQGTEGFSFRLVDPDNRVAPDWDELRAAVDDERTVADLWADAEPAVKPVLVRTLLDLRRRRPAVFGRDGAYHPIEVGAGAIAFARGADVVVAVRRGAAEVSSSLTFPPGDWYDVLDPAAPTLRGDVATASLVGSGDDGTLPVAVFERD